MATDHAYQVAKFERIDVDIRSLSDFARALREELRRNVEPAWKEISPTLLDDVPRFGNDPELELDDKRAMYNGYLRQSKMLLRNLMEGIRQMADAAEQIGAQYSRADQFAQVKADDVRAVLPDIAPPAPESESVRRGGGRFMAI
jgi:hypothetical protein